MLRHRLFDIDIVINRTLVYGALTASVVGIYVLLVGSLGTLFRSDDNLPSRSWPPAWSPCSSSRCATGCSAASIACSTASATTRTPCCRASASAWRRRWRRTRSCPRSSRRSPRRSSCPTPPSHPSRRNGSTLAAAYGTRRRRSGAPPAGLPARDGRRPAACAPRARRGLHRRRPAPAWTTWPGRPASPSMRCGLTADLQRSRERLVTAREEERRRLRRDLHDGLGPMLASLTLKATSVASDCSSGTRRRAQRCCSSLNRSRRSARSPTSAAWSTPCDHRRWMTSAWSARCARQAAAVHADRRGLHASPWRAPERAATAAGCRRGRRLPHRPGGADQCRRVTRGHAPARSDSRSTRRPGCCTWRLPTTGAASPLARPYGRGSGARCASGRRNSAGVAWWSDARGGTRVRARCRAPGACRSGKQITVRMAHQIGCGDEH